MAHDADTKSTSRIHLEHGSGGLYISERFLQQSVPTCTHHLPVFQGRADPRKETPGQPRRLPSELIDSRLPSRIAFLATHISSSFIQQPSAPSFHLYILPSHRDYAWFTYAGLPTHMPSLVLGKFLVGGRVDMLHLHSLARIIHEQTGSPLTQLHTMLEPEMGLTTLERGQDA